MLLIVIVHSVSMLSFRDLAWRTMCTASDEQVVPDRKALRPVSQRRCARLTEVTFLDRRQDGGKAKGILQAAVGILRALFV